MTIERSTGIPVQGGGVIYGLAGGGYRGITPELDQVIEGAAGLLSAAYGMDVVIRFNSGRESGGAFLRTHVPDCIAGNAEVGICAEVITERRRQGWERLAAADGDEGDGCWAQALAGHPAGHLQVYAHIRSTAVPDPAGLAELRGLPGWNSGGRDNSHGYHHGAAGDVAAALARCTRYAPPGMAAVR